jgi:hypothetical protein
MKADKRKRTHHLFPLILLAILTILMTYPLAFHLQDHLPSDLGDPLHHVWLIGHNLAKIKEGLADFWDGRIFYPHTKTVLYGDYVPALTFMAILPAVISQNLVFAYNFLWLLSFFLSGVGAYCLIFYLTRSPYAAFISSLIFAFSPVCFAHISHLELLFSAWLPFSFLFLHRYLERPNVANLSLALFFLILQTLSCGHYGLFASLFLGLFGLILVFYKGWWPDLRFWLRTISLVLVAALILIPFFLPYFPVHKKMDFKWTYNDVRNYSAEIQDYLAAPPWNIFWSHLLKIKAPPERQVLPGFLPLLLLILWMSCRRLFEPVYQPFLVKGLKAWFSFRKKPGKSKKQSIYLYILDIFIFLLFLDILIILSASGFEFELAFFRFSSRRLINPALILLIAGFLRLSLYPGWRQIKKRALEIFTKKTKELKKRQNSGPAKIESSPPSLPQINADLYLTMAILSWLFSFGPVISFRGIDLLTGPYNLLYRFLPPFRLMRAPARFSVMLSLSLSVLAGLALASFLNSRKIAFPRKPFLILIAGLILCEQISIPLPLAPLPDKGRLPEIYQTITSLPAEKVLLELPLPDSRLNYYQEALPMYYSLFHRHRIVNGYSGFIPPAYSILQEALESFPSEATLALLERLKIDLVLVHTRGYRPEKGKEIMENLKSWSNRLVLIDQKQDDFLYQFVLEEAGKKNRLHFKNKFSLKSQEKFLNEAELLSRLTWLKDKNNWKVWASSNVVNARLAVDNSLETGWSTAGLQQKNDFFWIDFGQEIWLAEVRLYLKNKLFDYPRHFEVEVSSDNINWEKIASYNNYFPYFDLETIEDLASYHVKIVLPLTRLRFLRFNLTADHPLYHWSIQEIECSGFPDH